MSIRPLDLTLADFPVTTIEKLRYADTDRQGHITNSVFAVWCQNARMELLCDPQRVPIPSDTEFVIARLVLEFRAEMHWPGTVSIGTRVERVGRSSVALAQALFVKERCVAVAESVVALMDTTTRRPRCLPQEVADALHALAAPNRSVTVFAEGASSTTMEPAGPTSDKDAPPPTANPSPTSAATQSRATH